MKYLFLIFSIWGLISLGGCVHTEKSDALAAAAVAADSSPTTTPYLKLTPEQAEEAGIQLGAALRKKMASPLRVTATIGLPPQSLHSVHTPVGGYVQHPKYLPGDYVRRGTLLCTIAHPTLVRMQRDYLKTLAQLKFLEAEKVRKETLVANDATAQRVYEQTVSEYEMAKAEVEGLRQELKWMGFDLARIEQGQLQLALPILAPANGYISEIHINEGRYVRPDDLLYEIVDDRHVHLELEVFAKDLKRVQRGQHVDCLPAGGSDTLSATVHLVSHKVDETTGTARVHAHFEQERIAPKPGTRTQAIIWVDEAEVWAVPKSAVIRQGNSFWLYLAKDSGFVKKQVQIGRRQGGWLELLDFVPQAGEQIVWKGAYALWGMEQELSE